MSLGTAMLPHAGASDGAMPSMNEKLKQWIAERVHSPAGKLGNALSDAVSDDEKVQRLSEEYARYQRAGIAFSVLQGFVLEQAAALGEKSLLRVIQDNDVTRAVAYRNRDLYHLFNEFGDLKLADKAAELGPARIRELWPYFGIDGVKQLVEGKALEGMTYAMAEKLPSREITLWVRQRKTDKARQNLADAAANGEDVPDYTPTPDDPHWLRLVREQSVTLAWRIRAEVAVLAKLCDHLATLKPQAQQRLPRAETAQVVDRELREIGGDLAVLHDALGVAFGVALDTPRADSRAIAALKTAREKLNTAVADETGRRAGESLRRGGMRGRPPASLDAAIESALKADDKAGDA